MKRRLLAASIAALLLTTCGGRRDGPEPIPLDRVNCARCGMLVSSEANAAQSRAPGEASRFFDDIGCLAADAKSRGEGTMRFVRLASGGWSPAESAWFALSRDARTPMDYGILAFDKEESARAADREQQARRWPAVVQYAEAR